MQGTMKCNRFIEPNHMRYEDTSIPQISDNDILIKVKVCGICGSDLVYYTGASPLDTPDGKGPLILGHEFSGIVAEIGATARKRGLFKIGDRVAVNPVQQCNACPSCMRGEFNACTHLEVTGTSVDGAMAEYVKVRYTHVYKIPDTVSFKQAALAEPLACATHAVERLDVRLGQTVVVYGVGGLGLMMTQVARAAGAGRIIAVARKDFGLGKALECGADFVINNSDKDSRYYAADVPARVRELNGGEPAQRAILATGNPAALQDALNVTGPCSIVVFFGQAAPDDRLSVPVLECLKAEKTLKFSWLAPLVWDNVFKLMGSGQVNLDPIITHEYSLEDAGKGIAYLSRTRDPKIKGVIIIDPAE